MAPKKIYPLKKSWFGIMLSYSTVVSKHWPMVRDYYIRSNKFIWPLWCSSYLIRTLQPLVKFADHCSLQYLQSPNLPAIQISFPLKQIKVSDNFGLTDQWSVSIDQWSETHIQSKTFNWPLWCIRCLILRVRATGQGCWPLGSSVISVIPNTKYSKI